MKLYHYTFVRACVRACESGRSREAIRPVLKKIPILLIARVGRYTKEPTDTTSNGTSPGLKETLCNSAGQKSICGGLETAKECDSRVEVLY